MSKLFITPREISLFSDITKELIKDVAGQTVFYYSIDEIRTIPHDVYGESREKFTYHPIEIEVFISLEEMDVETEQFGPEKKYKINVFFHRQDLDDRKIFPIIGDYLQFGDNFYEIAKLTQPDLIGGDPYQETMIKAECIKARSGQFNAEIISPQTPFTQVKGTEEHDYRRLHVLTEGSLAPPMKVPFTSNVNDIDDY